MRKTRRKEDRIFCHRSVWRRTASRRTHGENLEEFKIEEDGFLMRILSERENEKNDQWNRIRVCRSSALFLQQSSRPKRLGRIR
jgi:hypothetical protein